MLLEPHQRYFLKQMEQLDRASVKVTGRRPSLTSRILLGGGAAGGGGGGGGLEAWFCGSGLLAISSGLLANTILNLAPLLQLCSSLSIIVITIFKKKQHWQQKLTCLIWHHFHFHSTNLFTPPSQPTNHHLNPVKTRPQVSKWANDCGFDACPTFGEQFLPVA